MRRLGRYWHTLRHLRPIQLYGRLWFRFARPRVDMRPAPALRKPTGRWTKTVAHPVSLVSPDGFRFLNETHALADHRWDDPALEKLWRYNLHYFDDLTAEPSAERLAWQRTLLSRWVVENAPGTGTAWEPYPTSLRIVNWIKWARAGNELPAECVQSLAVQARWLKHRLEIHLLGNHLFANAKALVFAGLFFEGSEAQSWLERGLDILQREIPEQILLDGGQFERSPMYHALAVEDMLDLYNVATAYVDAIPARWERTTAEWPARIAAMRHWMLAMRHPDGEIGFFNDAALGIAPAPELIEGYAANLGLGAVAAPSAPVTSLRQSGYIRVEHEGAVALLDVGAVGPDYLPAHAHADTLSFELSLFGQRVIVNSGTSRYGAGAERLRQRGTAAHNTVVVDGHDSSEVWGGFRMARRARPVGLSVAIDLAITVRCGHDGYRRLPGRPAHERHWTFDRSTLTIDDRISGRFERAEARLHLHPHVTIDPSARVADGTSELVLRLPRGQRLRFSVQQGRLQVEPSTWHPEFGREVPNLCLVVRLDNALSRIHLDWNDAR